MTFTFITKLSPEYCINNIKNSSEADTVVNWTKAYFDFDKDKDNLFFHKIRGNNFRIQKFRNYRNSFAPLFYGTLSRYQGNTRIKGHFGVHWFTKIIMTSWFGLAIPTCFLLFCLSLLQLTSPNFLQGGKAEDTLTGLLFPIFFIGFGIGIVSWGKRRGRKEEHAIIEYVERVCKATR